MKKPPVRGGRDESLNPTLSPRVSTCLALLRQGDLEGWRPHSYHRVASYFAYINPIESLRWEDFARRCR
jgi:hypothetical protein